MRACIHERMHGVCCVHTCMGCACVRACSPRSVGVCCRYLNMPASLPDIKPMFSPRSMPAFSATVSLPFSSFSSTSDKITSVQAKRVELFKHCVTALKKMYLSSSHKFIIYPVCVFETLPILKVLILFYTLNCRPPYDNTFVGWLWCHILNVKCERGYGHRI